ncbi:MAG: glycosyltransferase family 1 protein [Bacteroidetes bacterium]|nr:glycosyltransferase family 1 protein [Bacteroidota bacterium]
MSLGNWLYYRKKYKLLLIKGFNFSSGKKKILGITYENRWELPAGWEAQYFNINSGLTIIQPPDLIIEREFNDCKAEYGYLYHHSLKKIVPKAFWFIDAHVSNKERVRYCDNFDFVFVAQSLYLDYVKKNTVCKNVFWLPLCYPGTTSGIIKNNCTVKYPISFVGKLDDGYANRLQMVSFLKEKYGNDFFAVTNYNSMSDIIRQSKITTNYSVKDDLNFRVFEVLGLGTKLLTNYVPDLDKIEGLKERLNWFEDFSGLKKHADRILKCNSDTEEVYKIQQWIKEKHTLKNRLAEMLQMIETGKQIEYK